MTVRELIAELERYPLDSLVVVLWERGGGAIETVRFDRLPVQSMVYLDTRPAPATPAATTATKDDAAGGAGGEVR